MLADKVKSDEQASTPAPRPRPRSTRIRESMYSRLSMLWGHRTDESAPKTAEWPPRISEPIPKTNESVPQMGEPLPEVDEHTPKTDEPKPEMDESTPKANGPIPEVDEPTPNTPAIDEPTPTPTPRPRPRPRARSTQLRNSISNRLSTLTNFEPISTSTTCPPSAPFPQPQSQSPSQSPSRPQSQPRPRSRSSRPRSLSHRLSSTLADIYPLPSGVADAYSYSYDPCNAGLARDREAEQEQRRMGKGRPRPRPASMFLPGKGGGGGSGGGYGWEVVGKGNDGDGSEEGSEDTLVGEKENAWRSRRRTTMFYGVGERAGGRGSVTWDVRVDERVRGERTVVDADSGRRYSEGATKRGMKRVLRGVGESFVGAGKWGSTVSPHRASCGGEMYGRAV